MDVARRSKDIEPCRLKALRYFETHDRVVLYDEHPWSRSGGNVGKILSVMTRRAIERVADDDSQRAAKLPNETSRQIIDVNLRIKALFCQPRYDCRAKTRIAGLRDGRASALSPFDRKFVPSYDTWTTPEPLRSEER